ncbi:hypothetical protein H8R17_20250 [Streptomyces sp. TRM68367]|nr:hypothetical protein [Streptomyces sp. TRM68367]
MEGRYPAPQSRRSGAYGTGRIQRCDYSALPGFWWNTSPPPVSSSRRARDDHDEDDGHLDGHHEGGDPRGQLRAEDEDGGEHRHQPGGEDVEAEALGAFPSTGPASGICQPALSIRGA